MKNILRSLLLVLLTTQLIACTSRDNNTDTSESTASAPSPEPVRELVCGDARFDVYLPFVAHKRVAVVANHTSMVGSTHLVDTLRSLGVEVVTVFTPEHGFRGTADAGEHVASSKGDSLDIVSLYGRNRRPTKAQMAGLDVVLYDLQDVGVRFFTYISTMHYMMEACAERGIPFVVLDRPNPQGDLVDGPVLEKAQESFVGMHPIPVLYGLTAGELACMISGEGWLRDGLECDLRVVKMLNYNVGERHELTTPPSPNLRTPQAIRLYPSLCLFEATNVSVGRGTDNPFTVIGAPIDSLGPFEFTPQPNVGAKKPLHNGRRCFGEDLSHSDMTGFDLQKVVEFRHKMGGEAFWKDRQFFDRLAGTRHLREQIESGLSADSIRRTWASDHRRFLRLRSKYMLYNKEEEQSASPIDWPSAMHSPEVDSLMARMTLDEKIGQLIWVTLNGHPTQRDIDYVRRSCLVDKAGGVLIMQSTLREAQNVIRGIQREATTPVFFAIDGENGIGRKVYDAIGFPLNISLGALNDTALTRRAGQRIAEQMKAVGMQVNFAPVADVNTNPRNPIIGDRSFGEDEQRVAKLAWAMASGMQSRGCVAVLKHFPGHGDTSTDSHKALPVVNNSAQRIDSVDIEPFRLGAKNGVMGVMSAHISVPALDASGKAASLSRPILRGVLREKLGFEGLIISDAMNMAGIRISAGSDSPECEALVAGNDVAEFSLDVRTAIEQTRAALADSTLAMTDFEEKVRRVLAAKVWCGLMERPTFFGAPEVIVNSIENEVFIDSLFAGSLTVLADRNNLLDTIRSSDTFLALGDFPSRNLINYNSLAGSSLTQKLQALPTTGTLWLLFDDQSIALFNSILAALPTDRNVVAAYAGNPYRLSKLQASPATFVMVYERTPRAKKALANFALYGGQASGILPVSAGRYTHGTGLNVTRAPESTRN